MHLLIVDAIFERLTSAVFGNRHGASRWSCVEIPADPEAHFGAKPYSVATKEIAAQWMESATFES